jgi:hypothetical protein
VAFRNGEGPAPAATDNEAQILGRTARPESKSQHQKTQAAKRQRRYRRRQLAATGATPARRHVRGPDGVTGAVTVAALALATVSAAFSIVGLTSIFVGSFWPIVGMGVCLECAKLSAVGWLGGHYPAPRALKAAIVTLIATLMMLNAIGAYGFLAHAHITAAVTAELPIAAHAADVDARRQFQAAAVADVDRRIGQIDAAVSESIRRGRSATALALAEKQTGRRKELIAERVSEANALAALQVEAAAVQGERAQVTADNGPVHLGGGQARVLAAAA